MHICKCKCRFNPAHGGFFQSDGPCGAELCPCPWGIPFLHFHVMKNNTLPPSIKLLPCLTIYNYHQICCTIDSNNCDSFYESKHAITLQGKAICHRLRKYHRFHYTASLYKTEYSINIYCFLCRWF